jgi:hypothetical protein
MDPGMSSDHVRALVHGRREDDVRRALARTRQTRPEDVLAFFTAALGRRVEAEVSARRAGVIPLRGTGDPYAS